MNSSQSMLVPWEFGELQSEWLKQYTHFTHGIPRSHCIANIIKMIEQDALVEAFYAWINQRRVRAGKSLIAIDGKTLRGTCKGTLFEALHVVSAYDVESGVALYHQAAESKAYLLSNVRHRASRRGIVSFII